MIDKFIGENFFLSNFYNTYVNYEGILYSSSEAAFQAAKTLDTNERKRISTMLPSDAKKAGRALQLRPDWEEVKDKVMYDVCHAKFVSSPTRPKLTEMRIDEKLLATGDEELVEGNTWHDNYWGNCTCDKCKDITGKNMLGKTLMRIRSELKNG